MSDQWWQKLKTRFKGDTKDRRHIWALGTDSSVQQILWEGFGDVAEVMYDNGSTPVLSLGGDVLPDIILADSKLFKEHNLSDQIKEDTRLGDVPVLILTDKADIVSDEQLSQWGATGIIYYPLDAEELKLKIVDYVDTDAIDTADKLHEISIDEFKLENLDEELRNLNKMGAPLPQAPPTKRQGTQPDDDVYTSELEKLLAEIDEAPTLEQKEELAQKVEIYPQKQKEEPAEKQESLAKKQPEESVKTDEAPTIEQPQELVEKTEVLPKKKKGKTAEKEEALTNEQPEDLIKTDKTPVVEQKEEAQMKADKKNEAANEIIVDQEPEVAAPEPEIRSEFPQMPSDVGASASSAGGVIEQWFHSIAEEKITRIIANHDFTKTIEDVARDVVPKIAEELVSKEIERIKRKIVGE